MTEHLDHRGRPRVVVTGVGLQTPAGATLDAVWSTLLAGRSVAAPIQRFDASPLSVRFGCEFLDFDPVPYLGTKESRRVDRAAQMGFAAAADALADAGDVGVDPARAGVIAGTGIGGLITLEDQVKTYIEKGPDRVSPFFVPMMMANATAGIIAIHLGWTGPNLCISTACAASANAIGEATRLIREGLADVVMAGGTECAITPPAVAAFARMGALSKRNDEPELASRPFDQDRDGFVMGEGAGMVVLERADRAEARGAHIYGEIAGYGTNSDAFHITAPSQGGAGAAACMQLALDDAGLSATDIGHVNAHGTSTALNDSAEAEAIRKVFGDSAPPVTSTKGVTGHLIGAAGAVEAIASLQGARLGVVPPTANHHKLGDDIVEIDVVHGEPRSIAPAPAISNSFGFGGHNASLVLVPAP
jgi:3-oxoacyl-[acyl-carrier-protein] synthase II